jgi:hypothetical protein
MRLLALVLQVGVAGALMWVGTRGWLSRRRARNAPLRREVEAQVCFATTLDRASILRKSAFSGTRGLWSPLQGPRRLTVGTDAFIFSAPNALREFYFPGRDCSIAFSQAPSRFVNRDWIVITGQADGRVVRLAIAGDNLQEVWQALTAAGAVHGDELPAGDPTRSQYRPARSRHYSLRWLAAALVIVLTADAAAWLGAIGLPWLGDLGNSGFLAAMVMFVVWLYRARVNADGRGWPQRRPPAAAIWCWFAPVVNLFVPFQIMADIWRAGLPAEARANPATLPGTWWACMLTFFLLSPFSPSAVTGSPANSAWYAGMPVKISGALAAITTALLVQKVSSGPLGREKEPAEHVTVAPAA